MVREVSHTSKNSDEERERSHKLINDWKQDVSSNIDSPVPRPSKNFNKPRKAPVIPDSSDEDEDLVIVSRSTSKPVKPNSPDNSSSATSQSQQSPAIDLTGSSPKSQPSSSASQSSKPPLDKQKPKPKQREDDLFTGRTIKKLNINDLNGTGPFAPPKQKQNLQVSPPKPFKPAPIFAPTNPPLSPVKTANMRIMDDRYETSTASKDSGKLAKDMLKSHVNLDEVDQSIALPPELKSEPLPHQRLGIQWMVSRERSKKPGGLLADDMGLGKTYQTIGLMLINKPVFGDPKSTLVVVPLALIHQWAAEIKQLTRLGSLRVVEHQGTKRTTNPKDLEKYDVIVTTYQTLRSEHEAYLDEIRGTLDRNDAEDGDDDADAKIRKINKTEASKNRKTALYKTRLYRVILDEAHTIRNVSSKNAVACHALKARRRWCLTGTPIQNSIDDLFSIFKFLGRISAPHHEQAHFQASISKKVKAGQRGALEVVLPVLMLRRTKMDQGADGEALLKLPQRHVEIIKCTFVDDDEQRFYDATKDRIALTMNKYIAKGSVMKDYTKVLVLLLRLRQACLHPSLVTKGAGSDAMEHSAMAKKIPVAPKSKAAESDSDDGANDQSQELADLMAGVKLDGGSQKDCSICQTSHTQEGKLCEECETASNKFDHSLVWSTKVRKTMSILSNIKKENPKRKTIIFCSFTTMFDILERFLKDAGYRYVKYIGDLSKDKREQVLHKIKNDEKTTIILISLHCGSLGLNLTACSRVILLDLWWNPAIEEQAIDRAHRFGQKEDVKIYKITIQDTVEERLLNLQEQKSAMAKAALTNDAKAREKLNKLSEKDLLYLFNGS